MKNLRYIGTLTKEVTCRRLCFDEFCSVERFSEEINTLLEITLKSRLVEKLCVAMYSCLFDDETREDEVNVDGLSLDVCLFVLGR